MLNASNTNKMNNIMSATFFSKTRVDRFFYLQGEIPSGGALRGQTFSLT
jgi:hypothetical protein